MFDLVFYRSVLGFVQFTYKMMQHPKSVLPNPKYKTRTAMKHMKKVENKYHINFKNFYFNFYMKIYFRYFDLKLPTSSHQ